MKKLIPVVLMIAISGCGALSQLSRGVQQPEISYNSMQFSSLSFDGMTLLFNFDVVNKNRLDLTAHGYSYSLSIDDNRFLEGISEDGILLRQRSVSNVQIPVTFNFSQLSSAIGSVFSRDSVRYDIASTFSIDLPVMGRKEVPVSASGHLPIPKLPSVSIKDVRLGNISLTGAEVILALDFVNPNRFGVAFSDVRYRLEVDGSQWVSTRLNQIISVGGNSVNQIEIPIRLDFAQVGSSVYRLMTSGGSFQYRLTGDGNVDVDLPYFDTSRIPFDISGNHRISN